MNIKCGLEALSLVFWFGYEMTPKTIVSKAWFPGGDIVERWLDHEDANFPSTGYSIVMMNSCMSSYMNGLLEDVG